MWETLVSRLEERYPDSVEFIKSVEELRYAQGQLEVLNYIKQLLALEELQKHEDK